MPFNIVWSRQLQAASKWVEQPSVAPIPRGKFPPTEPNLKKTLLAVQKHGSISAWFVSTINEIVRRRGASRGNLYRFAAAIMQQLLAPSSQLFYAVQTLADGRQALLGNWKRLWMAIMFLRRDESLVKCLLSRALCTVPDGAKAVQYWYYESYFSPLESQLPVDVRVQTLWPKIFNQPADNTRGVAECASTVALRYNIAPSTFDAIFFGY